MPRFNAFFTRRLREGARPVAGGDGVVVSPSDSRLSAIGPVPPDGRLEQVKGSTYTIEALLGSAEDAAPFRRGAHATLYLSPAMYHRVHAPVDGRVVAWRYMPGRLFPVNGAGVRSVPGLFTRNERVALFMDTEAHGPVAVVLVGAANVGRMSLAFADLVTNRGRSGRPHRPGGAGRGETGGRDRHLQPRLHGGAPSRRPRARSGGSRGRRRPGGPGPVATRLTVGVISDTHGLVRPEAVAALRGSDVILHAGDIGGSHVLQELGELAPVIPVRGNVDGGWARLLPERRILDLGGVAVLILHDRALVGPEPSDERPAASWSSATRTSRWPRSGRACSGSTPAAPGRGDSSCRCPWVAS